VEGMVQLVLQCLLLPTAILFGWKHVELNIAALSK
jgi:hypothetical protein